jgi:hypothetical protein
MDEIGGGLTDDEQEEPRAWPLTWRQLGARERWVWFEQLWVDVLELRERYALPLRRGWWEIDLHVEALAALAAWVARFDGGDWDDPQMKLELLHEIGRLGTLLGRALEGSDPFHPDRDRMAYARHAVEVRGAQLPPNYETNTERIT